MITLERLREVVDYDPKTGIFTWRKRISTRIRVGDTAGCLSAISGYILIRIDGTLYRAHRLAWFHVHGVWPSDLLDHRNNDRADNRLKNLREAGHIENLQNAGLRSNNTSGLKGVSWDASRGQWKAQICVRKRRKFLGRFATKSEAHACYVEAAKTHFGEYARAA